MNERIVIIGSDTGMLATLAAALAPHASIAGVLVEDPVPALRIFRRRMRHFGFLSALGQALFAVLIAPVLRFRSRERIKEICREHGIPEPIMPDGVAVEHIGSVNSAACVAAIKRLASTLVVVYGTRIIAARTLDAVGIPFINMHAGITPEYRGGHGAYWALAQGKPELCGVTVHRIDAGIDTGEVLGQACIAPTARDSFATYPYLQFAAGIDLIRRLLAEGTAPALPGRSTASAPLYAHPTLWEYIHTRVRRGVR